MSKIRLLLLLTLVLAGFAYAADATKPHVAEIDCGRGHFILRTIFGQDTVFRLGIRSQNLSLGPDKMVDLQNASLGLREGLQRADITGWACISGNDQKILVLAYSCASDVGDGCGGVQEWNRLNSAQGALLDPGFQPRDNRTETLLKRLGIQQKLRDGISLQEVLE